MEKLEKKEPASCAAGPGNVQSKIGPLREPASGIIERKKVLQAGEGNGSGRSTRIDQAVMPSASRGLLGALSTGGNGKGGMGGEESLTIAEGRLTGGNHSHLNRKSTHATLDEEKYS